MLLSSQTSPFQRKAGWSNIPRGLSPHLAWWTRPLPRWTGSWEQSALYPRQYTYWIVTMDQNILPWRGRPLTAEEKDHNCLQKFSRLRFDSDRWGVFAKLEYVEEDCLNLILALRLGAFKKKQLNPPVSKPSISLLAIFIMFPTSLLRFERFSIKHVVSTETSICSSDRAKTQTRWLSGSISIRLV